MNATAQTANFCISTKTKGLTSLLVIGAALGALVVTVATVIWQVAAPLFSLVPTIVSTLA